MLILNWQVKSSSNFASYYIVMTHNFPVNFKLTHFLLWIKGPNKSPNLRLSNVLWWKFAKFLMSFLEVQVSFPSNFVSILSAIKHNSSVLFSSNILYFGQKQPIKVHIFEIFECSGENLANSSCYFPNHKLLFLQILHEFSASWKITPLYFFRSKVIYFARKGPMKVQILKTFECSDQNSPDSCHF